MSKSIQLSQIKDIIDLALNEDIGTGDITTGAIFDGTENSEAIILSKNSGIFCGADIIKHIYSVVDKNVVIDIQCQDGSRIQYGDMVAHLKGSTKSILIGERTMLNFIQRMSGIATKTDELAVLLEGTSIKILDTRKTVPGLRLLDKYAVLAGGGSNHRFGLYDMVMIKDNHISAAGSISNAVSLVRQRYGNTYQIEVETGTLDEVREALEAKIDIIMLDNMDKALMQQSLDIIQGTVKVEVSGNMDKERIKDIRDLKIDFISLGALTHSVRAFDLSMKFS